MGNVEALTQVAAEAAADIQRLQTEVLTENNVKALRESVQTLTKTLQHIERITGAGGHGGRARRCAARGCCVQACWAGRLWLCSALCNARPCSLLCPSVC